MLPPEEPTRNRKFFLFSFREGLLPLGQRGVLPALQAVIQGEGYCEVQAAVSGSDVRFVGVCGRDQAAHQPVVQWPQ